MCCENISVKRIATYSLDIVTPSSRRNRRRRRDMAEETVETNTQNLNDGVEVPEIFSPDENNTFTARMPLQLPPKPQAEAVIRKRRSSADETDNEKNYAIDDADAEEVSYALDPFETEEMVEPCPSSSDDPSPDCKLTRSSYLQTKSDELLFAVNYHLKEEVEKILNNGKRKTR